MQKQGVRGYRIPKRTARIVFDGGEYEGAEVRTQLDVPIGLFLEIQDLVNNDRALQVFERFGDGALVDWNLEDDNGKPIPATGKGMLAIPAALANIIIEQWVEAVANPPAPLPRSSGNGNT